jgi:hypothetical protein
MGTATGSRVLPVVAAWSSASPVATAGAASTADARLRLDWQIGTRFERPVIQGYVVNDALRAAAEVRLLVEMLDSSGTVIARSVGFVRGVVASNDRSYFAVPLKVPGAAYRVSITAFDWGDSGGGTGGATGGGGM